MTQQQLVGYGLIAALALAFMITLVEPTNEDGWFSLVGMLYIVFGVWAAVLLLKK